MLQDNGEFSSSDWHFSMLSQGGSFEARCLTKEGKDYATGEGEDESKSECVGDDDGGVTMDNRAAFEHVKLRPRKTLFFSQDSEVNNADSDTFLQPASRNFESVDALAKPNNLFQVTCARVHSCKQNGLLKALSLLGNAVAPRLYFVVPPDVFEVSNTKTIILSGVERSRLLMRS